MTINRINQQITIVVFAVIDFRRRFECPVCVGFWSVASLIPSDSARWEGVLPACARTVALDAVQPSPVVLSDIVRPFPISYATC